jgi:DNA repair photolyase
VTDPYQPVERKLELTRRCLEVLRDFRNPVAVVTKSALVARDADLLAELASHQAAVVNVTITTIDDSLSRALEPRAALPRQRLEAVRTLCAAGVPVGIFCAPVIPGLTETMVPEILSRAAEAGAQFAAYLFLRLPGAVEGLFQDWLDRYATGRKEKILGRIRGLREGRLNDPRFGHRFHGSGLFAAAFETLFASTCRRAGLNRHGPTLSAESFRRGGTQPTQGLLFDTQPPPAEPQRSYSPILRGC